MSKSELKRLKTIKNILIDAANEILIEKDEQGERNGGELDKVHSEILQPINRLSLYIMNKSEVQIGG